MAEVSSHAIKLTGKAELPEELLVGSNYHVALEGSIIAYTESDAEDGTFHRVYTFKPVKVEVLTPLGETIKAKDTRSNSQLLRSLLYKKWVNAASNVEFEEWYTKVMREIMMRVDEVIDWV